MQEDETPLQELLAERSRAGRLDSTSEFTINSLKARQKLAQSQLPAEGLWLVKLVQAAVASKGESIEISFGKREVKVSYDTLEWPWEPRQVFRDFLAGVLPKEPALLHLYTGLRHCLSEDTLTAQWTITTENTTLILKFDEKGTRVTEEPSQGIPGFRLLATRPSRWPGFKKAAHMPVKHLIRRTAEEFLAVHQYCWPCPIPLRIDGRPLENRYTLSPGPSESLTPLDTLGNYGRTGSLRPMALVQRELEGPLELNIPWSEDEGERSTCTHGDDRLSLRKYTYLGQSWINWTLAADKKVGASLFVLFGANTESRIEFVCDGAVVAFQRLPGLEQKTKLFGMELGAAFRLLLPITPEQLDLSQFAVRAEELPSDGEMSNFRQVMKDTLEVAVQHYSKFRTTYSALPTNPFSRAASTYLYFIMSVHPMFYYLKNHGFRNELLRLIQVLQQENQPGSNPDDA